MKNSEWSPPSPLTSRDVISDPGRPCVNVQNSTFKVKEAFFVFWFFLITKASPLSFWDMFIGHAFSDENENVKEKSKKGGQTKICRRENI
jgi:hypothetical protein